MQLEGCDSITLQPSGSSSFAIGGDTRWSSKGLLLWGLREEPSELGRIGDENLPSQKETANGKTTRNWCELRVHVKTSGTAEDHVTKGAWIAA